MSGICGIVSFAPVAADPALAGAMAAAAPHRGAPVMRRLPGALLVQQRRTPRRPVPGPEPELGIPVVADAQIHNAHELAAQLGIDTGCDTAELIQAAYLQWGLDFPERLVGDFAFALWDGSARRLLAARDVLAMRSLHYRPTPTGLAFATEVNQLFATADQPPELNEKAIAAHLLGSPGAPDWTAYDGISALPPGHALLAEPGRLEVYSFWQPDPDGGLDYHDPRQYQERLRELFLEAVRARLAGVERAGIFLSGGLDSGAAASVAGWLRERDRTIAPLRAYSFAFRSWPDCDERADAAPVVDRFAIPLTPIIADDHGPLSRFPDHPPDVDHPELGVYGEVYRAGLQAAAADGVDQVMTCNWGDAVMGGGHYDIGGLALAGHRAAAWRELHAEATAVGLRRGIKRRAARLVDAWTNDGLNRMRQRWRRGSAASPAWVDRSFVDRTGVAAMGIHADPGPAWRNPARRFRYHFLFQPLDLRSNTWIERLRAQYGVEHSDPWADRRLVEFALAVPQYLLTQRTEPKRLARAAMAGIMPDPARLQARKVFHAPLVEHALRTHAAVRELVTHPEAAKRGFVDTGALQRAYEAMRRGGPIPALFWEALTLEWWLRSHWT